MKFKRRPFTVKPIRLGLRRSNTFDDFERLLYIWGVPKRSYTVDHFVVSVSMDLQVITKVSILHPGCVIFSKYHGSVKILFYYQKSCLSVILLWPGDGVWYML